MLAIERRKKILNTLRAEQRVVVADLSKEFDVTEETIRRDLEKLEKEGVAKKTYGGAVLNENAIVDLPYTVRKKKNVERKVKIAELVGELVEDGDRIMLDSSSTAVYVAKQLKSLNKKNLVLITNSIEILIELADVSGWTILSTGGSLKEGNLSLIGYQTERMLETFHVDKTVVSCKGIDLDKGCTDSNEADAHIKKMMLDCATTRILAADMTKFNKVSFVKSCDFENVDMLVSDEEPDDAWRKMTEAMGIEMYYSSEEG